MVVWRSSLGCPGPSKSSSRAGESLIFMFFQFQLSTGTFGSTWSVLGGSWAQLGASWPQLGRSWDQLGANLGAPGTNLVPTWALLEPSWDQLEPTLGYHGRSCDALGALLVTLRRLWTLHGRSRVDLGAPRRILASQRHDFDAYEPLFWSLW